MTFDSNAIIKSRLMSIAKPNHYNYFTQTGVVLISSRGLGARGAAAPKALPLNQRLTFPQHLWMVAFKVLVWDCIGSLISAWWNDGSHGFRLLCRKWGTGEPFLHGNCSTWILSFFRLRLDSLHCLEISNVICCGTCVNDKTGKGGTPGGGKPADGGDEGSREGLESPPTGGAWCWTEPLAM